MHVHKEWIVETSDNVSFVHYRFDASFCNNSSLAHFFHCKHGALFFPLDTPDFAETSLADAEMINEVCFAHSYKSILVINKTSKGLKRFLLWKESRFISSFYDNFWIIVMMVMLLEDVLPIINF